GEPQWLRIRGQLGELFDVAPVQRGDDHRAGDQQREKPAAPFPPKGRPLRIFILLRMVRVAGHRPKLNAGPAEPCHSWNGRQRVLFYPCGSPRFCLTFCSSPANSASPGGALWRRFSRSKRFRAMKALMKTT